MQNHKEPNRPNRAKRWVITSVAAAIAASTMGVSYASSDRTTIAIDEIAQTLPDVVEGSAGVSRQDVANLRTDGHEVRATTSVGEELRGDHVVALLGEPGRSDELTGICLAGHPASAYAPVDNYLTCRNESMPRGRALWVNAQSPEGFHFVAFVPGSPAATASFESASPTLTHGVEVAVDGSLVLAEGAWDDSEARGPYGIVIIETVDGSVLEFEISQEVNG